jgi:hypothetical protein
MGGTRRPPGGIRNFGENETNRGLGKLLSRPWWAGVAAIAALLAIVVAAVIAILQASSILAMPSA